MKSNPLLWEAGPDNMGGFNSEIVFIPANSVSAVPTLPAITDLSADADYVTAIGAFVFRKAGDKPKLIQCTDKTVKYDAANQGEIEGQSFAISGEFFRAGSKAEFAAFCRQVNNIPGYLILQDMNGKQIMVGQPHLPCHIKPAYDGGMARADRRGFKFTFTADGVTPMVILATPIDFTALAA